MADNLYERKVTGPFAALCGGNSDNSGSAEDCLSVAELEGGGYAVRDTKLGDGSPELRFTAAELTAAAEKIPGFVA
ncbi:DUF397 domain-containing protein [Streptacidiphilus sp. P02-A3a]|uniref:DUF397 domain-containing protein n=1 Tax=Streptacidiphilus sp. P02-A3a TaxID=2704468 RepID=UPI0015FA9335|nr:DUF397 domain-containing protein [Streptacidiphilus sp. P02-A3a]QMU72112.1 DUF397 domain-containing protein [Streptacidiphilus sp. P02-A3a]